MAKRSDFMMKSMNYVHTFLLKVSKGKIGNSVGNMPVIEIFTIGRKSGEIRRNMLTIPVEKAEGIYVVASKGGHDHHPAWYLNLEANPEVTVRREGVEQKMLARILSDTEKEELWPEIVRTYKGYRSYQENTTRNIPVVLLSPRS